MRFDRKKEAMRKIIVAQAETIKRLSRDINSLSEENQLLRASLDGISQSAAQYKSIIDEINRQNNEYGNLNNDIKNIKIKLTKQQKNKAR